MYLFLYPSICQQDDIWHIKISSKSLFWTRLTSKCASCRHGTVCTFSPSKRPRVGKQWSENGVFWHFLLPNALLATTACTFSTSNCHRIVKKWSESRCFVHVYFKMCFAPQRRALFRRLNFQKWSEHGVFCTCSLPSVLRATTACTFSTS